MRSLILLLGLLGLAAASSPLFVGIYSPDLSLSIRHCYYQAFANKVSRVGGPDFIWQITSAINGSTDENLVSIRSVNFQTLYICSAGSSTAISVIAPTDPSLCTFRKVSGLSDSHLVSFEQNGRYLARTGSLTGSCAGWYSWSSPESDIGLVESPIASAATWLLADNSGVSLVSAKTTTLAVRHCYWKGYATTLDKSSLDFRWVAEAGLDPSAGSDGISFRSYNFPEYHLCITGYTSGSIVSPVVTSSTNAANCTWVRSTTSSGILSLRNPLTGLYLAIGSSITGSCSAWFTGVDLVLASSGTAATWTYLSSAPVPQAATFNVTSSDKQHSINSQLYGVFFEEINFAGEGGLYAELIRNRDFEARGRGDLGDSATSTSVADNTDYRPWSVSDPDVVSMDSDTQPYSTNPWTLRVTVNESAPFLMSNPGFWGIWARSGISYSGSFYAKVSAPVNIYAVLSDSGVNISSSAVIMVSPVTQSSLPIAAGWEKYTFTITGSSTSGDAQFDFYVECDFDATVWLDSISLFPGDAVLGLFRKDVFDKLAELKPAFVRFPGGNYLEGNTLATRWDWKNTLSDIAARPGHYNDAWSYWTNDGLGIYEYFLLCEALDSEPLMSIFTGYTLAGTYVPLSQSGQYIQDAVDAVEYANGNSTTVYGKIRTQQGHAEVFDLKQIEVGNEEKLQTNYSAHYKAITTAVWAVSPSMKVIGSGYWWPSLVGNPCISGQHCDLWDEHYYRTPDVMATMCTQYDSYNRSQPKVFVGEYAANSGSVESVGAAIGEASFMIGFERNADVVHMSAFAPLFRHTEGTQWAYDMINYDSDEMYVLPSFYIQKLFRTEQCKYTFSSAASGLTTSVGCLKGNNTLVVKMVNYNAYATYVSLDLSGFKAVASTAQLTVLASSTPSRINSLKNPNAVAPVTTTVTAGAQFNVQMPLYSFALLEVEVTLPPDSSACVLNEVDAQKFQDPPVLTASLSGTYSDTVNLNVVLPQMTPSRSAVSAGFISPSTRANTSISLNFVDTGCSFNSTSVLSLPYLLANAKPLIQEEEKTYTITFSILVSWTERFTLSSTGSLVSRTSQSTLSFSVVLLRQSDLNTVISTLNGEMIWAYLSRFSVIVPIDHSSPTVTMQLLTSAVEDGYSIDEDAFVVSSVAGHVQAVSKPVLVTETSDGYQTWKVSATIDSYSICSTSASDSFTLQYTIVSSTSGPEHTGTLTATLAGLENWCSLNNTFSLNGAQTTHASASTTDESLRYFVGDVVHVRDHVYTDVSLSGTAVSSVVATVGSTTLTVYPSTDASLAFQVEDCPTVSPSWVCYSFKLSSANFSSGQSVQITTTVSASLASKRSDSASTTSLSSSLMLRIKKQASGASTLSTSLAVLIAAFSIAFAQF